MLLARVWTVVWLVLVMAYLSSLIPCPIWPVDTNKQTNKKTNYDLFSSLKAIALFFMKTKSNDNMEFMEFRLSFSLFLSSLVLGNKGGKTGF